MKFNKMLSVVFVAVLGLMLNAPSVMAASAGSQVDDAAITAKVKGALIANPNTSAHQINVETTNGVVQLNGFVDSASSKQAAESRKIVSRARCAVSSRNVAQVVNSRFIR